MIREDEQSILTRTGPLITRGKPPTSSGRRKDGGVYFGLDSRHTHIHACTLSRILGEKNMKHRYIFIWQWISRRRVGDEEG